MNLKNKTIFQWQIYKILSVRRDKKKILTLLDNSIYYSKSIITHHLNSANWEVTYFREFKKFVEFWLFDF